MTSSAETITYDEHWLTGPQSTQFYCRTYAAEPAQATLVFIHGFLEHIDRYTHVFPHFQTRGINVFTYDQRGFGRTAEDKQHRSADSSYGKTSGKWQLEDVEWAMGEAKSQFGETLPVFVMGQSMGGGIVLHFATYTKHSLAGIISTAPLILQTSATPKLIRWAGEKFMQLAPYTIIPAHVNAEDISRDPKVCEAYLKDPLVKQKATLRCISDMLTRGEHLLASLYSNWPTNLPLMIMHGTDDRVTSPAASQKFINAVPAKDKKISLYPGNYHELQNEPDGVSDRFIDECISWIEAHLPRSESSPRMAKL